jgi:hypothetical protein
VEIVLELETVRDLSFGSEEEGFAYAMDLSITKFRARLIEICQRLRINPERFRQFDTSYRQSLADKVHPDYQRVLVWSSAKT